LTNKLYEDILEFSNCATMTYITKEIND